MTKKTCLIFIFLVLSAQSFFANAARYTITGEVFRLDVNHKDINASNVGGIKLRLNAANQSAGACFKDSNGYVVIWIREDKTGEFMFSTLLAAQIANKAIAVLLDSAYRNSSNVCYAQQIRIL